MKKILLIFILSSCSNEEYYIPKPVKSNPFEEQVRARKSDRETHTAMQVYIIDSCEYIMWDGSHGEVGITHKGNCKNH